MVLVPGGTTTIGNDHFYPEERPLREVAVGDVWFDPRPVTNAEFARFVEETGHVTVAEVAPDAADFPGADPALLVPGSQVFTQTRGTGAPGDWTQWWRWQPDASWRAPQGPGSSWADVADHPVVHVGWEDATAYARWAGKDLADRGRVGARRPRRPGRSRLRLGRGVRRRALAGRRRARRHLAGPVPVAQRRPGRAPPHGPGRQLSRQRPRPARHDRQRLGVDREPLDRQPPRDGEVVPAAATASPCCGGSVRLVETDRFVTKGGSHLCSPHYCQRYRPAARQGHGVNDTTSHVGFRCVRRS